MVRNIHCKIIENKRMGSSSYYFASIRSREISTESKPGQFIMLGLRRGTGVLLRRPYSICGTERTFEKSPRNCFHLLYKVVGKGSLALSQARPGEEVAILGPLGNHFGTEGLKKRKSTEHIIIAGGHGSAPFPFLIARMNQSGIRPLMFYGGRSKTDLPLKGWFKSHCRSLLISTEDGSEGEQGMITAFFEKHAGEDQRAGIVYACGPLGMLKKIAEISEKRHYTAYSSFEERMACGFGVCLGCAVPIKDEKNGKAYKHVCEDGPVLAMDDIDFDRF